MPLSAEPEMRGRLLQAERSDGFCCASGYAVNDQGNRLMTAPGSLRAYHRAVTGCGCVY